MYPNINTGVGLLMSQATVDQSAVDTTGRFFIVGAAALPLMSEIKAMYPATYPDGVPVTYTTLKLALAQCVANRGDIILVVPGHTESITNATDLIINVAGVSVLGMGQGALRPTFTCTTAITATITISAANTLIQNVIVDATGFAAITSGLTITGANTTLRKNMFINATATNQAVVMATTTATATGLTVDSNYFEGTLNAGTTTAIQLVGGNDHVVINNTFIGAYTTTLGAINNVTTACLRSNVVGNFIFNQTAASAVAMTFVATSTGQIANNRMQILSGIAPIVGAAMSWVGGNYWSAVIGTAGALI